MGYVEPSPFNQDRCLGLPHPFIPCREDKEENFKLFHSMEVGEITYWLDCCERMTKVPFKASLRTAYVCSWFILKQLVLPQAGLNEKRN